jgi:hypothetical protein
MYPVFPEKGLIRCRNEGWAVDKSGSVVRRDQPILFRELRKLLSLEADMMSNTVRGGVATEFI